MGELLVFELAPLRRTLKRGVKMRMRFSFTLARCEEKVKARARVFRRKNGLPGGVLFLPGKNFRKKEILR